MAITVTINGSDGVTDVYPDGIKWHVDDHRQLHVVGKAGNIATYATGVWESARATP